MDGIRSHFSKTVDDYDTVADKVVFKNNELHENMSNSIHFEKEKQIKVLDLGCGTGHGIKIIAEKFPNSKITGIDFSPKMIDKARKNTNQFSERVKLLEMDFRDYEFDEKFDVVVSAIAIHNINDDEKKILFGKIYDSLKEDGIFINADFYEHEKKEINIMLKKIYREFLEKNLSGNELDVWLKHAFEEDIPMSICLQQSILKDFGFSGFSLVWIYNNEAVYVAKK